MSLRSIPITSLNYKVENLRIALVMNLWFHFIYILPVGINIGKKKKKTCTSSLLLQHTYIHQIRSLAQSCPTLCDPMNHSTPGLPVHHQLPEFTQTHVHRVSDAIQPSHPLSSPSPLAPNPAQHQSLFQWVNSSHEVAKVLEFQFIYFFFLLAPKFYFILKLYNIVLVLPNIEMNPPQVYMCSPSSTLLPPHTIPLGRPSAPVSCIEPGLATHFMQDIIHVSMLFSQIFLPSPSLTESIRLFDTSVSLLLSRT